MCCCSPRQASSRKARSAILRGAIYSRPTAALLRGRGERGSGARLTQKRGNAAAAAAPVQAGDRGAQGAASGDGRGRARARRAAERADAGQARRGRPLVSSSLLPARSPVAPGRSRITTCGRLFEGTDEISLGQTYGQRPDHCHRHHTGPNCHDCLELLGQWRSPHPTSTCSRPSECCRTVGTRRENC